MCAWRSRLFGIEKRLSLANVAVEADQQDDGGVNSIFPPMKSDASEQLAAIQTGKDYDALDRLLNVEHDMMETQFKQHINKLMEMTDRDFIESDWFQSRKDIFPEELVRHAVEGVRKKPKRRQPNLRMGGVRSSGDQQSPTDNADVDALLGVVGEGKEQEEEQNEDGTTTDAAVDDKKKQTAGKDDESDEDDDDVLVAVKKQQQQQQQGSDLELDESVESEGEEAADYVTSYFDAGENYLSDGSGDGDE